MRSDAMNQAKLAREMARGLVPQVNTYIMARAVAEVERETCDAIQRKILAEKEYFVAERFRRLKTPDRVTEPKLAYLMGDADAAEYYAALDAAYKATGYALEPGNCPALMAEYVQTQAEWALIEAAQEWFPDIDNNKLLCGTGGKGNGLETRQEYIDLLVKLVVNFPGYEAPAF